MMAYSDITEFSKNFSPGLSRSFGFDNIHHSTPFGVRWNYIRRERIETVGLSWERSLKAPLLTELKALLALTYGGAYQFVLIPDNTKAELFYVFNQDLTEWNEQAARSVIESCGMTFNEDSRGKVQTG